MCTVDLFLLLGILISSLFILYIEEAIGCDDSSQGAFCVTTLYLQVKSFETYMQP